MHRFLMCLSAAILALAGCGRASEGSGPPLNEDQARVHTYPSSHRGGPAADSSRIAVPPRPVGSSYLCGWFPHPPREEVILADIFFSHSSRSSPPTRAEIDSVRALGGEIQYVFNVPVVRARIERDRVPALAEGGLARMVQTVSDPRRQDLGVRIFFGRPAAGSDADRVAELGGYVEWRPDPVNDGRRMMEAYVPDSVIPRIKAIPGFRWIEVGGGCARG